MNPGTALDEKTTTYEDYIELYNPTDSAVSLKDFYLSDDTKKPLAGPLPDVEIAAGGYYCVYAVGKDGSMPEGVPSVPFALTSGETVTLTTLAMSESGVTRPVTVDTVTLPSQQTADTVYARMEDGADTFSEMRPSPGSSNQEAGRYGNPEFHFAGSFRAELVWTVLYRLPGDSDCGSSGGIFVCGLGNRRRRNRLRFRLRRTDSGASGDRYRDSRCF